MTDPIVQLSRALAIAGGLLEDLAADQRLPALRSALKMAGIDRQEQLVVMLLGAAVTENARTELGAWP